MAHDTSIVSLAEKEGRLTVTTIIIFHLRVIRVFAMLAVLAVLLAWPRILSPIVRELSRQGCKGQRLSRLFLLALPHIVNLIVTCSIVRLHPESNWLVILTKEIFHVTALVFELYLALLLTPVMLAFKAITRQVIKDYSACVASQKRSELRLYINELTRKKEISTQSISSTLQLHTSLVTKVSKLNKALSGPLLLMMAASRLGFSVNVYYYISRQFPPGFLVSIALNFKQVAVVCLIAEELNAQENKLLKYLSSIDESCLSEKFRLQFKIFRQQIATFPVKLTALKIFTFRYETISTMITTTMAYILILHQMDA